MTDPYLSYPSAILLGSYKARQACILKGLVRPEAYT